MNETILDMDENAVIDAVCQYLKIEGYIIESVLTTTQKGIDITARHEQKGVLLIEAKGGTSSRRGSARYGLSYTETQVLDRVARGFFTIAELKNKYPNASVALAVPKTPYFLKYLARIEKSLLLLNCQVLLVNPTKTVTPMKMER
ncbi:MAG: hypothetical protein WC421_08365 [Elusimicrobiales bacterium]